MWSCESVDALDPVYENMECIANFMFFCQFTARGLDEMLERLNIAVFRIVT